MAQKMRKKNPNDKYWLDRSVKARHNLLIASINESEAELKAEYKRMANKLIMSLKMLYMEIQNNPDILASHLYDYQKKYLMLAQIETQLNRFGEKEVKFLDHKLKQIYKNNHKILKETFPTITLNSEEMTKVINDYWVGDGLNFSDRIWKDKKALAVKLLQGINDALQLGTPTDELVKDLMRDFSVSYSNAKRLASTELAHVQFRHTLNTYEKAGLTQFRWLTAKDERVCEICGERDGKIYDLTDQLHNDLPHPNCRCSLLGVI